MEVSYTARPGGNPVGRDKANRTWWYLDGLNDPNREPYTLKDPTPVKSIKEANLVGSLLTNGLHAPALDFDFPCRLHPSRTKGHWHFYIDVAIEWEHYRKILGALFEAGLLQSGVYRNAIERHATFLRPPGMSVSCSDAQPDDELAKELRQLVRSLIGSDGENETDERVRRMEERVYVEAAAKIDEIVARRVRKALTGRGWK